MSVVEAGLERKTTADAGAAFAVASRGTLAPDENGICKEDYEALARFRYLLRRFMRVTEETARAAGLTPQQHQLLLAIKGQPNRDWSSITELARSMQLRHHAVGGLVDRSESAGLVRRTTDPGDRRVVRVALTEDGEKMMSALSERNLAELDILRNALRVPAFGGANEQEISAPAVGAVGMDFAFSGGLGGANDVTRDDLGR